jgi:hypothetical protein
MRYKTLGLTLLLLFVLSATNLFAQSHITFKIDVPFDFIVNDHTMPAGQYTITQASNDWEVISGDAGRVVTFAPAVVDGASGSNNLLIFHQLGDKYFLAELWPSGSTRGRAVGGHSLEREARKSLVARNVKVISGGTTKVAMAK